MPVLTAMNPKLSFTLPSLHDDTILDCRIYYRLFPDDPGRTSRPRGAVIAHPYAPLGGCYDDPVVGLIVQEMLDKHFGFICTFNFRGVYGGSGRTSWTGKAELRDYESIVGFMIAFLRGHDINEETGHDNVVPPIELVLGGYSYGSWICTHLPAVPCIWKEFETAIEGSTAAEIKARAHHLATQTNLEIRAAWAESKRRHGHTVSVGGDETSPEKRRCSGDATPRRSGVHIRKSIDYAKKIGSLRKKHHEELVQTEYNMEPELETVQREQASVAYLLVSPLLPPISAFTTLPFGSNALRGHGEEILQRLSKNASLAVFADNDTFTSVKKLRTWSQDLSNRPRSSFHFVEIEGAGHFWRTHDVQKSLRLAIGLWVQGLLGDELATAEATILSQFRQ